MGVTQTKATESSLVAISSTELSQLRRPLEICLG